LPASVLATAPVPAQTAQSAAAVRPAAAAPTTTAANDDGASALLVLLALGLIVVAGAWTARVARG
jgi:hypothetical protein